MVRIDEFSANRVVFISWIVIFGLRRIRIGVFLKKNKEKKLKIKVKEKS